MQREGGDRSFSIGTLCWSLSRRGRNCSQGAESRQGLHATRWPLRRGQTVESPCTRRVQLRHDAVSWQANIFEQVSSGGTSPAFTHDQQAQRAY